MKTQFVPTEPMQIRFAPFVDKTTGAYILGTDECTLTIKRPGGALIAPAPTAVWDTDVHLWHLDLDVGTYYEQGEWRIEAESNDPNANPQWHVLTWGDYVSKLDAAVSTRAQPSDLTALVSGVAALVKIGTGRWKVDTAAKQLTLYDPVGGAALYVFDLKGSDGLPNAQLVFERVPA